MEKQRLSLLFGQFLNREIAPEDLTELMGYIATCASEAELEMILLAEWNKSCTLTVFDAEQSERILADIIHDGAQIRIVNKA